MSLQNYVRNQSIQPVEEGIISRQKAFVKLPSQNESGAQLLAKAYDEKDPSTAIKYFKDYLKLLEKDISDVSRNNDMEEKDKTKTIKKLTKSIERTKTQINKIINYNHLDQALMETYQTSVFDQAEIYVQEGVLFKRNEN